jgi:hypothetical protein
MAQSQPTNLTSPQMHASNGGELHESASSRQPMISKCHRSVTPPDLKTWEAASTMPPETSFSFSFFNPRVLAWAEPEVT